jgi:predicted transcriptional regulator
VNQAIKSTRGSPKLEKEKVRLSLDISRELNDLLEQLAVRTGGTKSDVLRKAIALMEVAVDGKRRGLKLGLADKDQQLTTEIIGL